MKVVINNVLMLLPVTIQLLNPLKWLLSHSLILLELVLVDQTQLLLLLKTTAVSFIIIT